MSEDGRGLRKLDVGLYLDEAGQPAGIKLFSNGNVDERLTTDTMGQFHFTRWRHFETGWKVDSSMLLSMQATRALTAFIRSINVVASKEDVNQ